MPVERDVRHSALRDNRLQNETPFCRLLLAVKGTSSSQLPRQTCGHLDASSLSCTQGEATAVSKTPFS